MPIEREPKKYDIAIIGSGMAGSSLAIILAKHGLRVVVFEAKTHPRFSIGESMILETSETMRAMAELYEVPELAYFSSENYFPLIGTSHGVKRHFSFLHHQEGHIPAKEQALQAVIPKEPHGHELHIYRQDSDAFLVNTAISYGATVLQNTPVISIDFIQDSVNILTQNETYKADYVVDAGGFKSLIAEKFQLRHFDLQTHSRAIFTHMVDVNSSHGATQSKKDYGLPFDIAEGTIHHVFEGGWLWVIPFNNHAKSTNPLCSVGLMLDPRIHPPQNDMSAEEEFFDLVSKFPGIKAHFDGAKAVRSWTRTGRIQYSSKQVVGERWAVLGHAAGFIDPLFSKGLYSSLTSVSLLAHLLLEAHITKDYSRNAFLKLEQKTIAYLQTNDRLIANAYKSFSHSKLWSTYSTLWLLGAYTELVKLSSSRTRSKTRAGYFEETQGLHLAGGGFKAFTELSQQIDALIEGLDLRDRDAVEKVTGTMQALMHRTPWMPQDFKAILDGKNHLPRRKLRLGLLRRQQGFLGQGDYRKHFFGETSVASLLTTFVEEKRRYGSSLRKINKQKSRTTLQQLSTG